MRKFIVIAALLVCSSGAHAGVQDRFDNWIRTSEIGHLTLNVIKWLGFPPPARFR